MNDDTIESLRAERDAALAACAEMRAALEHWTHVYGAALCPPGPDTYGEGMRDAKDQVRAILARTDLGRGMVVVEREVLERWRERLSTVLCCLHSTDHQAREMIVDARADLNALLDGGKGR